MIHTKIQIVAAKTAFVEKPASHDGEHSTEDCVSQCDSVTEDHCQQHRVGVNGDGTEDHCRQHHCQAQTTTTIDGDGTEDHCRARTTTTIDGTEDHCRARTTTTTIDGTEGHCRQQQQQQEDVTTAQRAIVRGPLLRRNKQTKQTHRFPYYLSQIEFMTPKE
jgi:hypothetical protein